MKITAQQFRMLGRACFFGRLVHELRMAYPRFTVDVETARLVRALEVHVPAARSYGMHDEYSLAAYLHAAWLFGNNFDIRIPIIAQILSDPDLAARDKARALGDFSVVALRVIERNGGEVMA